MRCRDRLNCGLSVREVRVFDRACRGSEIAGSTYAIWKRLPSRKRPEADRRMITWFFGTAIPPIKPNIGKYYMHAD